MLTKRSRSSLRCSLYRIKNCVLILLCIAALNSCKKESLHEDRPNPAKNVSTQVTDISYSNFLAKAPLSRLGSLKTALLGQNNGNNLMTSENLYLDLNGIRVYRDSVRQIVSAKGTSYVFKMPLASTNSRVFQNFTISMLKDTTIAFVTTYTPSDQWLLDRKKNKFIVFQGGVAYQPMDLNGKYYNNKYLSTGKGTGKGNTIASSVTICNSFDIVQTVAYGCSDGNHMPWDDRCAWNTGQEIPDGDYKGGYRFYITPMTVCSEIALPDNPSAPGGTGDTGGGETSPTTPGDYNPCEPGMPCGSIAGDGPAYPFVNEVGITNFDEINFLNKLENIAVLGFLKNYREAYGNSEETKEFIRWVVGYLTNHEQINFEEFLSNFTNKPFNFESSQETYVPKDREPASYYWRLKLKNAEDFSKYLTFVPINTDPIDLYNCHYHAFGELPNAVTQQGSPKHLLSFVLPPSWTKVTGNIQVGDRIGYYVAAGTGPAWTHSGIVTEVDTEGYATKISSKIGPYYQIIEHHPRDIPESYGHSAASFTVNNKSEPSRIYWRKN